MQAVIARTRCFALLYYPPHIMNSFAFYHTYEITVPCTCSMHICCWMPHHRLYSIRKRIPADQERRAMVKQGGVVPQVVIVVVIKGTSLFLNCKVSIWPRVTKLHSHKILSPFATTLCIHNVKEFRSHRNEFVNIHTYVYAISL